MKIVREVWSEICEQSSMEVDETFMTELNYYVKEYCVDEKTIPIIIEEDVSNAFKGIHNEKLDKTYLFIDPRSDKNYPEILFDVIYDMINDWVNCAEFKIVDRADEAGDYSDYVVD